MHTLAKYAAACSVSIALTAVVLAHHSAAAFDTA
jgi:hypothetical protein